MTEPSFPSDSEPVSLAYGVTIFQRPRHFEMVRLTLQELDMLSHGYNSVHLALFGPVFGAALTIGVTVLTIPLDDRAFAVFIGALIVTFVLSIYFGLMAFREWRTTRNLVKMLKTKATIDL